MDGLQAAKSGPVYISYSLQGETVYYSAAYTSSWVMDCGGLPLGTIRPKSQTRDFIFLHAGNNTACVNKDLNSEQPPRDH